MIKALLGVVATLLSTALLPAALAAQVTVTQVSFSPDPPTFADAITFKIEVFASSTCAFDENQIDVEALPGRLVFTLPPCADNNAKAISNSLIKLVEHQLPGIYQVDVYPAGADPVAQEALWSSSLEVIDPPYEIRESDPIIPALSCDTPNAAGEPCAYQKALVEKLKLGITPDPMVFKWQTQLDWTFNNWRNGGSQNLPLLAQALALVTGTPDPALTKIWWKNFFDCQLGQTCPIANPGTLVYYSGGEILSNNYNEHSLLAAMVVNFWFTREQTRDLVLANKARRFLRSAWYLYALAAGNGPARSYFENGGSIATNCQWSANNRYSYDGPFLALAGARSKPTDGCLDDRAALFARGLLWEGFTRSGENREQKDLRQFLEDNYRPEINSSTESVFALDNALRANLKAHIRGQQNLARWFVSELSVRLSREMRFLGWSGGIRATVLSENPNTCNSCLNGNCKQTAALYATKFDPKNQGEASFLFPWDGGIRRGLTRGYGKLQPTNSSPIQIEASNRTAGDPAFTCQSLQIVRFPIPTSGLLFHVAVGPTGASCVVCP